MKAILIDWNAYGRLDRLYVKEYMEEKEAVVTILLDTSASMDYGARKKSELACMLAAAMAYLSLNNMDRVLVYDMKRMQSPLALSGGKKGFPRLQGWLSQCRFEGTVDVEEAVKKLPAKGPGVTFLISDFFQEAFLNEEQGRSGRMRQNGQIGQNAQIKQRGGLAAATMADAAVTASAATTAATADRILRFLEYRRQKPIFLHVLAHEERSVELTGTKNLIDVEDGSTLRVTLDASSIRVYEQALRQFCNGLERSCAKAGAVYAVCDTGADFNKLIFQDLRVLYDI